MDTYDVMVLKAEQPTVAASYYSATCRGTLRGSGRFHPSLESDVSVKWKRVVFHARQMERGDSPSDFTPSLTSRSQVSSEGPATKDELPVSSPG